MLSIGDALARMMLKARNKSVRINAKRETIQRELRSKRQASENNTSKYQARDNPSRNAAMVMLSRRQASETC